MAYSKLNQKPWSKDNLHTYFRSYKFKAVTVKTNASHDTLSCIIDISLFTPLELFLSSKSKRRDMAEEGQVHACHTNEQWREHFEREKSSEKLVVVDFTASWCGPCRFIAPILSELAKKMHHVLFLKVDVDELREVSEEFKVEAMPSFVFLKEGKEIDRVVGARKEELQVTIEKHATIIA